MQRPIVRCLGLPLAVAALALMITAPAGAYPAPQETDEGLAARFWEPEGGWSDPLTLKGIREGDGTDRWEILSSSDDGATWTLESTLEAIQYLTLPAPPGELGERFSRLDQILLIGAFHDGGVSRWVAGVVTGEGYAWNDRAGRLVRQFSPFLVGDDPDLITEFAETYHDLYDGSADRVPPDTGYQDCACRESCAAQLRFDRAICTATSIACIAVADAALVTCALGCAGVPICEAFCIWGYNAAIALCSLNLINCRSNAMQAYGYCMDSCPPEPE